MGVERILGVILNYASFVLSAFFASKTFDNYGLLPLLCHCYNRGH